MSTQEEHRPVLPHLSAMLLALRYMPTPANVLELGLGGGALQRFFNHFYPESTITTVELDRKIIEIYREFFDCPNGSEYIIEADAQTEICNHKTIDLLIIDLFSERGSPEFLYEEPFYKSCFDAVSKDGVIVINLLPELQMQTIQVTALLEAISGFSCRVFSCPGYRNRIIMCAKAELPRLEYTQELNDFCQERFINLNDIVEIK